MPCKRTPHPFGVGDDACLLPAAPRRVGYKSLNLPTTPRPILHQHLTMAEEQSPDVPRTRKRFVPLGTSLARP